MMNSARPIAGYSGASNSISWRTGMPWFPCSGISGLIARARVIASRRKSTQSQPARWYMRIASMLSLLVMSQSRVQCSCLAAIDNCFEQRRARAGAAVGRDERDELGDGADDVEQRAADRAAVVLDREPVEE